MSGRRDGRAPGGGAKDPTPLVGGPSMVAPLLREYAQWTEAPARGQSGTPGAARLQARPRASWRVLALAGILLLAGAWWQRRQPEPAPQAPERLLIDPLRDGVGGVAGGAGEAPARARQVRERLFPVGAGGAGDDDRARPS